MDTMLRRRASTVFETSVLPFDPSVEHEELGRIHSAIGCGVLQLLQDSLLAELQIPLLVVENDKDGDEARAAAVETILGFIKRNCE